MAKLVLQPAASRYFKKLKDKNLKQLFKDTIKLILDNPTLGEMKQGDLAGIQSVDIHYNKTNYELAYLVELAAIEDNLNTAMTKSTETIIVIILAGTRENFYQELKRYIKKSNL